MKSLVTILIFVSLNGCTSIKEFSGSRPDHSAIVTHFKKGDECAQTQIEARWLAQIVEKHQDWIHSQHKRYSSNIESLIGSISGAELRYNVMFLQINSEDSGGWSFYTPSRKDPIAHANNLFRSIARDDNSLLTKENRHLWIDSQYRTDEFSEDELKAVCPDCVAGENNFKVAIVSKFKNGKIDLWTLEPNGVLNNPINGCKK